MASQNLRRALEPRACEHEPSACQESLEREIAALFPSGIHFSTKRRRRWSPDELSEGARAEIIRGLRAVRAIVRSYSRTNSVLFDFLEEAGFGSDRSRFVNIWHRETDVFRRARSMVDSGNLLPKQRTYLKTLVRRFEAVAGKLDLLIHGLIEVRELRSGKICFFFELWGKRQAFTRTELESEAAALEDLAAEAALRLARPWKPPPPGQFESVEMANATKRSCSRSDKKMILFAAGAVAAVAGLLAAGHVTAVLFVAGTAGALLFLLVACGLWVTDNVDFF